MDTGNHGCAKPSILEEDDRVHATEPVVKWSMPQLGLVNLRVPLQMALGCGMVIPSTIGNPMNYEMMRWYKYVCKSR